MAVQRTLERERGKQLWASSGGRRLKRDQSERIYNGNEINVVGSGPVHGAD